MKVTLRQAHKLVEKITGKMAQVNVTATVAASIYDERAAEQVFAEALAEYKKTLNRKLDLMGIRQEIRTSVQAVNGVEVNGLVSARKSLLDQLAVFREVTGTVSNVITTPVALAAKVSAEHASTNPRSPYGNNDTVSFCVLGKVETEALNKQISDLQLRVEAIEDQLTTSNASASIILSEQTVAVLRREGLVQ